MVNYLLKKSVISKGKISNEAYLKVIFDYNNMEYKSGYLPLIENYAKKSFDYNVNLKPFINHLKKHGESILNKTISED